MIKYELKKLFTNRFVIAMLIITAILTVALAAVSYHHYTAGYMPAEKILLKKGVLTEITVNEDNVGELLKRYDEIINDDSNYDYIDSSASGRNGGRYLYGKYADEVDRQIDEIYEKYNNNGIVSQEGMDEISKVRSYQISDEVYPEFAVLHYILSDFTHRQLTLNPDMYNGTFWELSFGYTDNDESDPCYTEGYNKRTLYEIEHGITYDRNFGWQEITDSGQNMVPLLLALTVAVASVVLFTGEYTGGTDVLIMSSRHGRKRAVTSKIIAGSIFSVAATVYYLLLLLIVYGCFFSLDGAGSSSQTFIGGRTWSYIECFGFMAVCCILCILAITMTALAVSSFCNKTLLSVLIIFVIVFAPFLLQFAVYLGDNPLLNNIVDTLSINAILHFFNYSHYSLFSIGSQTAVLDYNLLTAPFAVIQIILSLPFIGLGWKTHRISR